MKNYSNEIDVAVIQWNEINLEKKPGTVFLNADKSPLCFDMNINSSRPRQMRRNYFKNSN